MQHALPWLATTFARPSLIFTLFALAGLVRLLTSRHGGRWPSGRWLLVMGILPQAALLVLPFDRWAARPLEEWYPQLSDPPAHVDGIVVLGGAQRLAVSLDRHTAGLNADGERLTEFMALARRYPLAKLVYTGGAHWRGWGETNSARLIFRQFGLETRVIYEGNSSDTWENALFTQRMVNPRPGETWILVTSAMHMPRAVAAFRAVDWPVLADPVAFRTPHTSNLLAGVNIAERLETLDVAAHEWIGLAEYRLRGHAVLSPAIPGH